MNTRWQTHLPALGEGMPGMLINYHQVQLDWWDTLHELKTRKVPP